MSVTSIIARLLSAGLPGWRQLARRSWCSRQRSDLSGLDRKIVWLHDGDKMPWALWGADNGFFELEWAGHLPYLRAVALVG